MFRATNIISNKRKPVFKNIMKHWQMYLIILLPTVYLIIFSYIPMNGILLAFKRYSISKGIYGSPWVGFKLFQQFFASPSSIKIIFNTIFISLYSIIASFPIPIFLAIALNEVRSRLFKKTVQMVTYAPYFISTVVMVGLIMQVMDPRIGIINKLISIVGIEPINFLGIPKYFTTIYVFSGIWQGAGYSAVIYLAALSGVSKELQEASIVDGASRIKRIWHVDLPSIKPTIIILLMFSLASIMNVGFEKIYLMQNSLNSSVSEVLATFVYKVGMLSADYSFSTAVGLFSSIVNMMLLVVVNFISKRFSETKLW